MKGKEGGTPVKRLTLLVVLLLAASVAAAPAQQQKETRSQKVNAKAAAAGTTAPALDPEAVAAVEKMEACVKSLTA